MGQRIRRQVVSFLALFWMLFAVFCASVTSAQTCRQALVLGLDVSLSVDVRDFRLQREGLARAFLDADVVQAMTGGAPGHVELAIFEWSGQFDQRLLIDWTIIETRTDLEQVARTLRLGEQVTRSGRTAIGAALLYARALLRARSDCAVRTFDISGDGMNNNGPQPKEIKARLMADGVTVNALVIGLNKQDVFFGEPDLAMLSSYFLDRVIVGNGAFVETVLGFDGYFEAIRRKLLRELLPAFVQVPPSYRREFARKQSAFELNIFNERSHRCARERAGRHRSAMQIAEMIESALVLQC